MGQVWEALFLQGANVIYYVPDLALRQVISLRHHGGVRDAIPDEPEQVGVPVQWHVHQQVGGWWHQPRTCRTVPLASHPVAGLAYLNVCGGSQLQRFGVGWKGIAQHLGPTEAELGVEQQEYPNGHSGNSGCHHPRAGTGEPAPQRQARPQEQQAEHQQPSSKEQVSCPR